MRGEKNSILEEFLPAVRRRSLTTLDGLLKNTIAESFRSYISGIKDHKKALKQSEEAISSHFKKINSIITMVDEHIARRLQNHQNELFAVVKSQIQLMKQQTKEIGDRMNMAIAQKNTQDQIWRLNNELDYFKAQTLSIFNHNKKMKEEIINLAKSLREAQIQMQNNNALMQKLKKKYLKENFIKQRIITFIAQAINSQQLSNITLQRINEIVNKTQIKSKFITERSKQEPNRKNKSSGIGLQLYKFDILQNLNQFQSAKKTSQQLTAYSPKYIDEPFFLHTNDKSTQTQALNQNKEQVQKYATLRNFSNTSYVQLPINTEKKINLLKNGFSLRTQVKKPNKISIDNAMTCKLSNQSKKDRRYMSIAFNKNKVGNVKYSNRNKSTQQF